MADIDISATNDVVDKRVGRGRTTTGNQLASYADQSSIASMKARLTTINATSYTAARLATMTKNDMAYALRLNDDTAGI